MSPPGIAANATTNAIPRSGDAIRLMRVIAGCRNLTQVAQVNRNPKARFDSIRKVASMFPSSVAP